MTYARQTRDRRSFLKQAALAASAAFPLLAGCRGDALAQKSESDVLSLIRRNVMPSGTEGMGAIDAPERVLSRVVLAKDDEPGEPLIVSGTVFQPDGATPAPNILIYIYHTDAEGVYGRRGEHRHGRFRAWLLTDENGRYQFRTIKPASYPNSTISSHIHMTITGENFREDWIDSILFEGDRFITAQERSRAGRKGGFNPILKLEKGADGRMHGTRDIRLWQI
jgi:protocatechuate 3,4-dioxygenase, beta subunit